MNQFDQEIYQKIIETHTNVNNLVKSFDAHVVLDEKNQVKTESSLDDLKEFKWKSVGIVGAILVGLDIAMKVFIK